MRLAFSWTSLLDAQIWQRAADAFVAYAERRRRSQGGSPKRMLIDFVVAAHALLAPIG